MFPQHEINMKTEGNASYVELIGEKKQPGIPEWAENALFKVLCQEFGFRLITSHHFNLKPPLHGHTVVMPGQPSVTWMFAK